MKIQLGFIEQCSSGYSTHLDKELTAVEFEQFSKSIEELHSYENLKRLYEIVILNHNELVEFIETEKKSLYEKSLSVTGDKKNYYEHHLNLNRMMLNYLTTFRTLLDHTETINKRKYGKNSNESKKYKQLTNKLFDKYFAYRFFYKLRNYSQHCGIPIDEFEVSATVVEENKFKPEYKIEFSSIDLLNKFKYWGPVVTKDLQKKNTFSLFPLFDEMTLVLKDFWTDLISIFENDIRLAVGYLNENAGHLKKPTSIVCIFSDIKTDEYGNMQYFTSHHIPFDIIEEFRKD